MLVFIGFFLFSCTNLATYAKARAPQIVNCNAFLVRAEVLGAGQDSGSGRLQQLDCVWLAVPQATEWQRVGEEIDAVMIFARSHFVNVL